MPADFLLSSNQTPWRPAQFRLENVGICLQNVQTSPVLEPYSQPAVISSGFSCVFHKIHRSSLKKRGRVEKHTGQVQACRRQKEPQSPELLVPPAHSGPVSSLDGVPGHFAPCPRLLWERVNTCLQRGPSLQLERAGQATGMTSRLGWSGYEPTESPDLVMAPVCGC